MEDAASTCWLCARPLGKKVQWHHTVPKAKKGRDTVPVHPICHRTIHANVTNAELVRFNGAHMPLVENEKIARFVRWVRDKPPDFYAATRKPKA